MSSLLLLLTACTGAVDSNSTTPSSSSPSSTGVAVPSTEEPRVGTTVTTSAAPGTTELPPTATSAPKPAPTSRLVTGNGVRTRVAPSVLVAEGPRRLDKGESVSVVCQAGDLALGPPGAVDDGSGVWFLLEDGLWVSTAYVQHEDAPAGSTGVKPYFDAVIPECRADEIPTATPTTTVAPAKAEDCGIIALQGGQGPRVTVEAAGISCQFAVQLMDGILRGSSRPKADGTWQLGQWTCRPAGTGTECTSPAGRIRAI